MVTVLPVVVLSVVPVVVEADVVEPDVAVVVVPDDRRTTDNDSHLLAHNFTLARTKPQFSHTQSTQSTQSCELSLSFLCEDCSSGVLEAKTLTELREESVSDSLLSHLRGSRRRTVLTRGSNTDNGKTEENTETRTKRRTRTRRKVHFDDDTAKTDRQATSRNVDFAGLRDWPKVSKESVLCRRLPDVVLIVVPVVVVVLGVVAVLDVVLAGVVVDVVGPVQQTCATRPDSVKAVSIDRSSGDRRRVILKTTSY